MTRRGSVTALVPAYQSAGFIQRTLDCLSAQTRQDFAVLVSVDLSDDDTHAVCQAHAARDARFTVFQQPQRLGYVGNCNFLLSRADADYALFAFHDDFLAPTYLDRLCGLLDARAEVVLSYSDVLLTRADGTSEQWVYTALDHLANRKQRGLQMLKRSGQWWVPNRGVFRLQRARRIGGLKTHGAGEFSADWPWLFHMSLLGEFARVPEMLCHKFYMPGSLSRTWDYSGKQRFEVAVSCMRELWMSELDSDEKLWLALPLTRWLLRNRPGRKVGPGPAAAQPGADAR